MARFSWMFSGLIASVCVMIVSPVQAQERPQVELVSVHRGESIARIRVNEGGRLRDINTLARRYARAPGLHIDMEMIADRNPNGIIYVCYDNVRGERPMMRRDPALVGACVHHRMARWLVAGRTYNVPLQPEAAPMQEVTAPVAQPVAVNRNMLEFTGQARIIELESQLASSQNELAEVRAQEAAVRLVESERGSSTPLWVALTLFILVAISLLYYRQHQDWSRRVMWRVNGMYRTWAVSRERMRKHIIRAELEAIMHKEGMIGAARELGRVTTRFGRLRKRCSFLLVQLAKHRKLLHQSHASLQIFQRQQSEDIARRERLPRLLNLVDQARIHQTNARKARARSEMILHWLQQLRSGEKPASRTMRSILVSTYRRMLSEYRADRLKHEALVQSCEEAKTQAIDDLYAMTGMRTDSVDPQGRLEREIHTATRTAEVLQVRTETLNELIQVYQDLTASQTREHEARVAKWKKEHEASESVAVWTESLVTTSALTKLTDVERRMYELEGRTAGLERRAITAEQELEQVNDFVGKLQPQYKMAKELLDEIKKGPNYLDARVVQMAEYIRNLEDELGIQRKSIWSGLPEVAYGAIPSKGNA